MEGLRLLIGAEHDVIARIYEMYEQSDDAEALQKRLLHVAQVLAKADDDDGGEAGAADDAAAPRPRP